MKISIQNLGAIQNANIELKPLTVFIGENNTGKTWTAYLISYILSTHSYTDYIDLFNTGKTKDKYPEIETIIKELKREGSIKVDSIALLEKYGDLYINNIAKISNIGLKKYFQTNYASFEKLIVRVDISNDLDLLKKNLLNYTFFREISPKEKEKAEITMYKESRNRFFYIYTERGKKQEKLPKKVIDNFIYNRIFWLIHQSLIQKTYIFPSDRTGFSTLKS